jgi:hypothetical protein
MLLSYTTTRNRYSKLSLRISKFTREDQGRDDWKITVTLDVTS